MNELEPDLAMGLIMELSALNLIHFPGFWAVATEDYGNYQFDLTTLGKRFVERFTQ